MTAAMPSRPLVWMIGGSLLSCAAVVAVTGRDLRPEIVLGLAAPLLSAVASWLVIERTHATAPERLTNVLVVAFGLKAVLFGAYVAVVLAVLDMRPLPFIASFTSYYVALHFGEALLLKRLLAAGGGPRDDRTSTPLQN
jgi:hypothetical protein